MRKPLSSLSMLLLASSWVSGQTANISGTILDSAGAPLAGASVQLERAGVMATSGSDGTFALMAGTSALAGAPRPMLARIHSGRLFLELPAPGRVSIDAYGVGGRLLGSLERELQAGSHALLPPGQGSGVRFYRVRSGAFSAITQGFALGKAGPAPLGGASPAARTALAKASAGEMYARPMNGDPTIQNDFPNETGVLNHHPGPNGEEEDNHHMVTGSTTAGILKGISSTCKDWTTSVHSTDNGKPTAGLAFPRGTGTGASNQHWISGFDVPGCAAGIEIILAGPPSAEATAGGWIGGGGGYGGFYCFALL